MRLCKQTLNVLLDVRRLGNINGGRGGDENEVLALLLAPNLYRLSEQTFKVQLLTITALQYLMRGKHPIGSR